MSRADLSDPAIKTAFDEIKRPNSSINWILLGYVPKSDIKIQVVSQGNGGFIELKDDFNDGKVLFSLIAFDINNTRKFVYLSWCGEGVVGMKKGLFNNHANDVSLFFKGFHVQINARNEADLDENAITERLKKATGASYDSGQKVQGGAKLVPTNVQQGIQQAQQSNIKAKQADKSDYNKKQESEQYWNQKRQEEDQQKQVQPPKPSKSLDYNKTSEREQFWAQQNQEKPAPPQRTQVNVQGNASGIKNRFEKGQFDQQQQQQPKSAAPTRSGPPSGSVAPKPVQNRVDPPKIEAPPQQHVEETQQEEPETQEEVPEEPKQSFNEEPQQEQQEELQSQEEPQQSNQEEPQQSNQEEPQEQSQSTSLVRALYDYDAENEGDLSFKEGDMINILDKSDPSGWWQGEVNGNVGFFPSNFVE